jgi:hypothetical protein
MIRRSNLVEAATKLPRSNFANTWDFYDTNHSSRRDLSSSSLKK